MAGGKASKGLFERMMPESLGSAMIGDSSENANVRAARIHALGDLIQSIGVILAALIIVYDEKRFKIADPICTFIFSIIVFFTTTTIVKDCMTVIMEGTPGKMKLSVMREAFDGLKGVYSHHDLHVWQLSSNKVCLTVHLLTDDREVNPNLLADAEELCKKMKIHHWTIQVETTAQNCFTSIDQIQLRMHDVLRIRDQHSGKKEKTLH